MFSICELRDLAQLENTLVWTRAENTTLEFDDLLDGCPKSQKINIIVMWADRLHYWKYCTYLY